LGVENPSEFFLAQRPQDGSGSVIVATLEGTRPILVEIQALVSQSSFGLARRRSQGVDFNRLCLLVAVLEKRLGLKLQNEDVFVNVAGGIKLVDPACDLAVALAIASSFMEKSIPSKLVVVGEVGLTQEVRSVSFPEFRIKEAARMGFEDFLLPLNNIKAKAKIVETGIRLHPVASVREAMGIAFEVKDAAP
jgi:DNA repair protein RadA/Sms